jgi:hypothetical protein
MAHGGGMTGEEIRPLAVSGALALIGYWTVVLWPKRKKPDPDYRAPFRKMPSGSGHPQKDVGASSGQRKSSGQRQQSGSTQ